MEESWHARVTRLDAGGFARFLERRSAKAGADDLQLDDLALAYACLKREPEALAALERDVLAKVAKSVARVDRSPGFRDEVMQQVRELLLVEGAGRPPRLSLYLGKGPLVGWARTVVLGTALNLRRSRSRAAGGHDSELMRAAVSRDDLELKYLQAKYRVDFEQSLRDALATLDARTRNVLRLKFADRLTLQQIGRMYRVHATTVMRWLDEALATLGDATRASLAARLKVPPAELDSVLSMVGNRIDASIGTLLASKV